MKWIQARHKQKLERQQEIDRRVDLIAQAIKQSGIGSKPSVVQTEFQQFLPFGTQPEDKSINVIVEPYSSSFPNCWCWFTVDSRYRSQTFPSQEEAKEDAIQNGFIYFEPE